jgi:hypothetical protein
VCNMPRTAGRRKALDLPVVLIGDDDGMTPGSSSRYADLVRLLLRYGRSDLGC